MIAPTLIFAAPVDFLQFGAFIVVILIWVIRFFANFIQEAKANAPQAKKEQPAKESLQGEIEKFLREAEEQRGTARAQTISPRPVMAPREADPRSKRGALPQGKGQRSRPLSQEQPVVMAELARESLQSRKALEPKIQQRLDQRKFPERTGNLANESNAPRALEAHVHQVFDHQVGTLANQKTSTILGTQTDPQQSGAVAVVSKSANALDLGALTPAQLRQAIVINEILKPPVERW
jgi:hypothetical protein